MAIIISCPCCGGSLRPVRLLCASCGTSIEGSFELPDLAKLPADHQEFIKVFLLARGNISEVERMLGVSYPTVRNRLDTVLEALGAPPRKQTEAAEVLNRLERGEITVEEALKLLQK
jgi:hypothetical protein